MGFKFDPAVEQHVMNPLQYTTLGLYYQAMLRTGPGLALYEMARRYATNPSHRSFTDRWEWWHDYLTGQAASTLPLNIEYKYFKRNVLNPAVNEVNTLTNVVVEFEEIKEGRRVVSLRIRASLKQQSQLDLSPAPVVDGELIAALMDIGFSARDAQDLCATEDHGFLKKSVALLHGRLQNNELPKVASPSAYFRKLLRDRAAEKSPGPPVVSNALAKPVIADPAMVAQQVADQAARDDAWLAFQSTPPEAQQSVLESFIPDLKGHPAEAYRKQGLASPLVRHAFVGWLVAGNRVTS
jgi:hypothetical protein